MLGRTRPVVLLALLVLGVLATSFHIQPVKAAETIYIREDGSIYPPTAPIWHTADKLYYMFTNNIVQPIVVQRSNIELDGAGCTLQVSTRDSRGITLDSARVSNVTVTNTYITQCQYGIYLDSSSGNNLSGNHVVGTHRYGMECGIYLYSSSGNNLSGNIVPANMYGIYLDSSSDNTLVDNNAAGNTKEGIHAYSSSNNTFQGNDVSGNGEYGLHLQGSSDSRLLNNSATGNIWSGIYLLDSRNNTLSGNNAAGNIIDGIHIQSSSNNTLLDNNATENHMRGIYLEYSSNNNTLSGNNVTGNDLHGLHLHSSSNNTLSENNATKNGSDGIYLHESCNNTVCANNITENGVNGVYLVSDRGNNTVYANNITANGQYGVSLASPTNTVYANTITANNASGVYLRSCSSNTIYGNNITTNKVYGAWLSFSSNNTIYGNNITDNGNFGVWLFQQSDDNMICGNNILNNSCGVSLVSSKNNRVYHNSFNGSTPQASSSASTNTVWDDGYPNGGNCWSDYAGSDEKSGPSQSLPGSDGIGDTPHTIDSTNRDNYPLISAHYVVVTNITCFKTVVGQGCCMNISATVSNCGTYDENVNLTLFANSTLIGQKVTPLTIAQAPVFMFTWNVSGCVLYNNYTLTACASPVSEGTSFLEHNCTGGCVVVALLGDITSRSGLPDGRVDMADIGYVARRFPSQPGIGLWDPNADINNDEKTDMKDVGTIARHFGEPYP